MKSVFIILAVLAIAGCAGNPYREKLAAGVQDAIARADRVMGETVPDAVDEFVFNNRYACRRECD